ncbi:hypothetical protein V502_07438 [Pseudogymnoascus sp. VKM F-4520 (FW-2644)]|nr:hypothetical protein V502_07438 [Pseudogymnoascus sp. VKM F-4520 (FW-2644)]
MVYKGTNEEAVREILQVLPKDLEKLYGVIFDSIEENCIASSDFRAVKQTLKWLLCAEEALDGDAILAAISLEERPLSDPLFRSSTRTKESLISLCRNFVEEDKGDLRISHQSVLDFLTKKSEFSNVECHIEIARCCLLHLCQSEYDPRALLKPKGLYRYAATFWALHYSAAKEHTSLTDLFQEFSGMAGTTRDQNTPVSIWMKGLPAIVATLSLYDNIVALKLSSSISDEPTSLFAACAFSLRENFAKCFSSESYANFRNVKGQTALHVACEYGAEPIIDLLLQDGNYPIEMADENGETAFDVSTRYLYNDAEFNARKQSIFQKLLHRVVKSPRFVPTRTIVWNAILDSSLWDIIFGAEGVLSANQNPIQYIIDLRDATLLTKVLIQHPELKPNTELLSNCLGLKYPKWELCATLLERGDDFDIDDKFLIRAAFGTPDFWEALLPHVRCKTLPDEVFKNVLWNSSYGEAVLKVLLQHFSVERLTLGMIVAARERKTFASLGLIIEQTKTHSLESDEVDIIMRDFPATTIQLFLKHFHDIRVSPDLIEVAIDNTNRGVLMLFLERIPNFDFDDDFLIRAIRQLDRQTLAVLGERRQIQASKALFKRVFSQSFGYDLEIFDALLELPRDFQLSDEICIEILSGGAACFSSTQLEALLEPPNSLTGKLLGPFLLQEALSDDWSQEEILAIIFKRKDWLYNFEINEALKFMLFREAKSLRSIEELLGVGFLITDQLAEAAAGNRYIGRSLLQRWLHSTSSPTITEPILKASKLSDKSLLLLLAQPCPLPMGQGVLEALLPGSGVQMVEAILLRKEITSINAQILMAVNESKELYSDKIETLSALSKDSRLERTEEVAIVLASFRNIQPMLEYIQHTPSFETTDRILQAAIVNFNMVSVLLPIWNGQIFTESILKRALKYPGYVMSDKIGVERQIVANGKKIELSQAVIKHGVKEGASTSLVYLIEHQGSIDIDLKLLEWVAMHDKHETSDVFGALIKHQSYGYFSTETMIAAAIKNGRFMVECVLRHVRSEDWNNVVTDGLLVSAVKQRGRFGKNLSLIELFLKYAPIPDILVTSTFILLLVNSMGPAEEGIDLERVDDVNDYSGSDDNGGESDRDEGDDAFIDEGESERSDEGNDFSGRTNSDDVDRFVDEEGADSINDDLKCNDEEDDSRSEEDESSSEEDDNDITVSYTWDLDLIFDLLPLMTSCPRDDTKEIARVVREMAEKAQYPLSEEHTRHLYKMLGYSLEPSSKLEG